jgi:two-component system alkaline phosphatase synthesis response regulator PhoP
MAILVVEDDDDLADVLSYMLRRAGHDVILASDGDTALRLWRERLPELVLLDISLPRRNGWEVCEVICRESNTPVMILSGADREEDIVHGLDLGAGDYITKPFSPRVVQARVRTLLLRNPLSSGPPQSAVMLTTGDLTFQNDRRKVSCGDKTADLSRLEHLILAHLAVHVGQVVPHTDLIEKVWGYKGETSSSIVKGHIGNVRRKLTEIGSGASINIVPHVGYILIPGRDHRVVAIDAEVAPDLSLSLSP